MKPSTLASGVRTSWETMLTSSDFSCSLCLSCSFLLAGSPTLLERLRHRVERARELSDLTRPSLFEAQRQVAAGEAARADRDVADRPRDRPREEHAEEDDRIGAGNEPGDAERDRAVGPLVGGHRAAPGARILRLEERVEQPADLVGPLLALGGDDRRAAAGVVRAMPIVGIA